MITPPYLTPGDTIGLTAPARFTLPEELLRALEIIKEWGLQIKIGKYLYNRYNQFAGTDDERAGDFQEMLDNPEIKAILCVRGGYGSVRTLQGINFNKFCKNPKWIAGYSDITVFHSYITRQLGIETLHSAMLFNFGKTDFDKESILMMKNFLFGKVTDYRFDKHHLNINGMSEGILTGGNLSVLYSLRGTPADIEPEGKILFIEDIDEYLYHIDRMMMNLKYGGKLKGLKGVIVGDMIDLKDNNISFGKNAYEIIADVLGDLDIPVCFGFTAGHDNKNYPLVMGRKIVLTVSDKCSIKFKN
jgi:muramoyltetrapeptide carboxypeptidase